MQIFIEENLRNAKKSYIGIHEYHLTGHVRFKNLTLTGYITQRDPGYILISLNIGINLDNFVKIYNDLNDTQIRMLKSNLPEFMGWIINTYYDRKPNYVHFSRALSPNNGDVKWLICNLVEFNSVNTIYQGILNLSYVAAVTIEEISKSKIPFANSQTLLSSEIKNRLILVQEYLTYCRK